MTKTKLAIASLPRPALRGHIHRWFAVLSVPAFIVLICLAQSTTARVAMVIYGVGVAAAVAIVASRRRKR